MIILGKGANKQIFKVEECRCVSVNKKQKTVKLKSSYGSVYSNAIILSGIMSPYGNGARGVINLPEAGDWCVVLVSEMGDSVYIVGYFDPLDNDKSKKDYAGGDWVYSDGTEFHSVEFRRNGLIKLKSNPYAQFILNPEDSSASLFSKKFKYFKDQLNYLTFDFHEDDDDRESDVTFTLAVHSSKDNSLTATKGIQEPEFLLRIGKTEFNGITDTGSELSDFNDDSLFKMKVENYDSTGNLSKVKTVVSIGETSESGYLSITNSDIKKNEFSEYWMKDSDFKLTTYVSPTTSYKYGIGQDGVLNLETKTNKWDYLSLINDAGFQFKHSVGVDLKAIKDQYIVNVKEMLIGDDSKKHPLAKGDIVVELFEELYDAIMKSIYLSPTGPTKPGPTAGSEAAFMKWKRKIKKLKSGFHYLNG